MNKSNEKRKIISVAILRVLASSMIFLHHYLKSIGAISSYTSSPVIAIGIFTLLAGIFSQIKNTNIHKWIYRKITRIIIPVWIVVIPLILANIVVGVKNKSLFSYALELIGMQLFVDQLFESTWFVTLILILYFSVYVSMLCGAYGSFILAVGMVLSYFLCSMFGALEYVSDMRLFLWIALFYLGYRFAEFFIQFFLRLDDVFFENLSLNEGEMIGYLSGLTFYFYLAQAPVLYLMFNVVAVDVEFGFIVSILISLLISVVIGKIDCAVLKRFKI